MVRPRLHAALVWLCIASYFVFGALLPSGTLYCYGSAGHAALELSGGICSLTNDQHEANNPAGFELVSGKSCVDSDVSIDDYAARPDDTKFSLVPICIQFLVSHTADVEQFKCSHSPGLMRLLPVASPSLAFIQPVVLLI